MPTAAGTEEAIAHAMGTSSVHPAGGRQAGIGDRITIEPLERAWGRQAADLLALAFVDEPGWSTSLGGTPRRRFRLQVPEFRGIVRGYLPFCELHGALLDGRLVGIGLRVPPGRWPPTRREKLGSTFWGGLGHLPMLVAAPGAVRMFFTGMAELERRHPVDQPHWYLAFLGVHPAHRRRGIATRLARYVLDQADSAGVGCYFETAGPATVALYRRLGFEIREQLRPVPGAPTMWTMWHEPRPSS